VVAAASPIFLERLSTLGPGLTDHDRTSGISEPRQTLEFFFSSSFFSCVSPSGVSPHGPRGFQFRPEILLRTALVRATAVYVFRQSRIIVLSHIVMFPQMHRVRKYIRSGDSRATIIHMCPRNGPKGGFRVRQKGAALSRPGLHTAQPGVERRCRGAGTGSVAEHPCQHVSLPTCPPTRRKRLRAGRPLVRPSCLTLSSFGPFSAYHLRAPAGPVDRLLGWAQVGSEGMMIKGW
jgi:hypothetical protein